LSRHQLSPEGRARIAAANRRRAGRKHTPETRAKLAAASKGLTAPPRRKARGT
jgi:hypothetical protein